MAPIEQQRWVTTDADFAVRIDVQDVPGFFSRKLTIDPGVRAIFLEKGQSVGEVPQGEYTLQTLFDRLKFWTKTSTTVILTRAEEIPLDLDCTGLLTKEYLEVDAAVRLTVQLDDVALFLKNLLGPRNGMTRAELKDAVLPVVRQALWETIGRLSIQELTGQQARGDIELCIRQALQTSLSRNGLKFAQVQTLSVSHPEYDAQRRKTGQQWLQRNDLQFQEAEAKLTADKLFAETQQREHLDEIEILAKQVASDRFEQELGVKLRRVGLRKEWRAAIQAETFDKINSEEELRRFLQERDKAQLIDADEYAALTATLKDLKADRESKRAHLLRKLDIEQECELRGVRAELDHTFKLRTLQHEAALAQATDAESNRVWQGTLKKEREATEHRRTQELQEQEHMRSKVRMVNATNREEELTQILHDQQVDRVRGDIEISRADRQLRIMVIQTEARKQAEEAELDLQERRNRIKQDDDQRNWQLQQDRLKTLQQLDLEQMQTRAKVEQDKTRQEHEREARAQQHKVDMMTAAKDFGIDGLMAVSENAAILADVAKTRVIAESQVGVAQASSQAAAAVSVNAELKALHEKRDADHTNALNQMMQLFQQTLQTNNAANTVAQDRLAETAIQISRNLAPQPPAPPTIIGLGAGGMPLGVGGGASTPPVAPTGVLICTGCRGENPRENRYCSQCGKPL